MGPFAQQLVSYPTRPQVTPSAVFHATQIYNSGSKLPVGTYDIRRAIMLDATMQGAMLNGLYNLSAPIQFLCPTTHCRWDDFATLAVTSSCINVTAQTKTSQRCGLLAPKSVYCNYTTPGGFGLESTMVIQAGSELYLTSYNSSTRIVVGDPILANSSIIDFAVARFAPFRAEECSMRWSARVFSNTTATNGTFNNGKSQDLDLVAVANTFKTNRRPGLDEFYKFTIAGNRTSFRGNASFAVRRKDYADVKQFLKAIFDSQVADPFGAPLEGTKDLAGTLQNIGTSMTYLMNQSQNSSKVIGEAISSEQFIRVRWPWIVLPLCEVCMAVALLICTLIHTKRCRIVSWKSSGIVPLLTVMEGWGSLDLRASSWRELEKQAKKMHGIMIPDRDDVQYFKRVDE